MAKTILFACPNELIQKVVRKKLKQDDFDVILVDDGDQALTMLNSSDITLDLLVTEEYLPFKSGFELIKICDSKGIPSILISDTDLENKIMEAFDLGVYDFIDKPYSPNELSMRVKNIFKHQLK